MLAEQAFTIEKLAFAGRERERLLDEQFKTEMLKVPALFRTDVETVMVEPFML
jgi:hypothetical protein